MHHLLPREARHDALLAHTSILRLLSITYVVFYLPDLQICTIQENGLSAMLDRLLYGKWGWASKGQASTHAVLKAPSLKEYLKDCLMLLISVEP